MKPSPTPLKQDECIHYKLDLEGKCTDCKKLIPIKCMCQDKAAEGQPHVHYTPPSSPLEEKILYDFRNKFTIRKLGFIMLKSDDPNAIQQFISEVIAETKKSNPCKCKYRADGTLLGLCLRCLKMCLKERAEERKKLVEMFEAVPSTPGTSLEFENGYHSAYKNVRELLVALSNNP